MLYNNHHQVSQTKSPEQGINLIEKKLKCGNHAKNKLWYKIKDEPCKLGI